MEIPLSGPVGVPCGEADCDNGQKVGRSGEDESLNAAVAECLDHAREEICDGGGGDDTSENEHE